MRIAVLTPAPPHPPRQGAALRNLALLRALASAHEVWLFTLGTSVDRTLGTLCAEVCLAPPPAPRRAWRRALAALAGRLPDLAQRRYQPTLAAALRRALATERFDAVQIEGLEMAAHWLVARRRIAARPWAVYDAHNAEHVLQARAAAVERRTLARWPAALYSYLQAAKLRRYERVVRLACDLTLAVGEPDRAALAALAPDVPVELLPNGVDVASYAPAPLRPQAEVAAAPRLLFFGTLDYRPNVDAARWLVTEIWPPIRAALPGARCTIVGARPTPAVAALGRRPGVMVLGDVPDVRPHLAQADVVVVPLRFGSGSRLKVLEALAAGRPVISTPLGCEGLAVRDGRHVLLAEDTAAFVVTIRHLCQNERLRQALASAGRKLVEERYDWAQITPRLLALYAQRSRAAVAS